MDIQRPDLLKKRQQRRVVYTAVGVVLFIASAYGVSRLEPAAPDVDRQSIWIDTVKRGELLREVRGPGQLVPKETRWIAADTPARVEKIIVRPGAAVEPDTVILSLSNPELDDQVLAARAAFEAARADTEALRTQLASQLLDQQANIASVRADYESAKLQAEAETELNSRGIVSALQSRQSVLRAEQLKVRLDIEQQRLQMQKTNLDAQIGAQQARLAQLQATFQLRESQARALQVRAGMQGILQIIPVEEGQQLLAGTNLARVARPDVLRAELRVPETQAKDVAIGQSVRVDTRNGIVPGTVVRIDPAVVAGTVQVDVDLIGDLPPGARPDLSVDGTIEIEKLSDVLYVGRPAFAQSDSRTTLFKLDDSGERAVRTPVALGRASVSLIEITQGLQPGDRVVLSDTSAYDAHDRLRLR